MAARPAPPKPTLVVLVRHGQTATTGQLLPGRAPGLHLADAGRAQADKAAQRLGAMGGIAAVYASPLERTRETAAPIGKPTGPDALLCVLPTQAPRGRMREKS